MGSLTSNAPNKNKTFKVAPIPESLLYSSRTLAAHVNVCEWRLVRTYVGFFTSVESSQLTSNQKRGKTHVQVFEQKKNTFHIIMFNRAIIIIKAIVKMISI